MVSENYKLLQTVKEEIYKGLPASKGISMGQPFIYNTDTPTFEISSDGRFSSVKEINDYHLALEQSKKELTKIFKLAKEKLDEKNLQIFEAQFDFINDKVFHKKIVDRIKAEKSHAYKIFCDEISLIENNLLSSPDEYLRERVADIEDIKNRILRNINRKKLISKIEEEKIVVARSLTPADTILFSNRKMLGFATDLGGLNSHLAIIARSINIPAVVGTGDVTLKMKTSDFLIIDGYKGIVIRNPKSETIQYYKEQIKKNSQYEKRLYSYEKLPTVTLDGKKITLTVNLEFNKELDYIITHAGCGVGLYRTEHLFLEKGDFPTMDEQYKQYRMIADKLYPNVVTIRTFDIGGDKLLPVTQRENNPFLGWRGIRICLDKKEIFINQLKAILRASRRGNVRIMFPMINSLEEIVEIKKLLNKSKAELTRSNIQYDKNIKAGIMVEVPSAVFIVDDLARQVDFFSIGTNDLVQYILAVDRDSAIVSNLYRKFHPAVLKAVGQIIDSAKRNSIGLSVCGEMAGDPLASLLFIGMGVEELSVETTSFLRIKKLIRMIRFEEARENAEKALMMKSDNKISEFLENCYKSILKNDF
jgi:phosphotransferase system enzyme I (PtsI)